MSDLTKSEKIKKIIQIFVNETIQRTSEKFSIEVIDKALKNLEAKYSFLKYVTIKKTLGEEEAFLISVGPEIDDVEASHLSEAVSDIFTVIIKSIIQNENYYLIDLKELRDDIESQFKSFLGEFKVKLRVESAVRGYEGKVSEVNLFEIKRRITKDSETLQPTINVLVNVLQRDFPKKRARELVINSVKQLEKKHFFLKYVLILDALDQKDNLTVRTMFEVDDFRVPQSGAFYMVETISKLDKILSTDLGKAIQELIEIVGESTSFKTRPVFISDFKDAVGPKTVSMIEKMGVDLDSIEKKLRQEGYAFLTRKTLKILLEMISSKTSISYAVESLDRIIEQLRAKHDDVLKYIVIDKSRYNEGIDAVTVMLDIEKTNLRKLGRAIREIIKQFQEIQGDIYEKALVVKNLKQRLGKTYTRELENIGAHLHLLEMRFR